MTLSSLHPELLLTQELIYDAHHFTYSAPIAEPESAEYGAYTFNLNNVEVRFRVAKTTPTKVGQFVVLWKRIGNGPIQPYDISDPVDLFIISARKDDNFGQFVFPKAALCKHGIISVNGKGGKRAIRVYPPWEKILNRQAQKTQQWQLEYFLEMTANSIDRECVQQLYL